ncbi:hypothetical protein KZZ52_50650 [Dactylosporangium sp. AC04546]|uniref:hypothetical protein n=1 Tax=Dactylosporangium sp. AC04546 TaxID=2862460 RepID=UPI001EDE9BAA|nr:hypothetical protein [Dactylosporangium sp. AC04546]WVK82135.1 hypothetical protein KZZ52_50650 [Dactylosporangium sp. AC04546]
MALLAMTSPLAPVVAALEGLRRRHPEEVACIAPGLIIRPDEGAVRALTAEALAVLLVAGWTRAHRVPLLFADATFLTGAGRLGITRARVAVLDGDPSAGQSGVVVARTRRDLLAIVQDNLCALSPGPGLAPAIHALTERWSLQPTPAASLLMHHF